MLDWLRKKRGYISCERCHRLYLPIIEARCLEICSPGSIEGDWCPQCIKETTNHIFYLIGAVLVCRALRLDFKEAEEAAITGLRYDFPSGSETLRIATSYALRFATDVEIKDVRFAHLPVEKLCKMVDDAYAEMTELNSDSERHKDLSTLVFDLKREIEYRLQDKSSSWTGIGPLSA